MNTNYSWNNDEIIVAERMKDLQRKAGEVHLLRKAGLANTGERVASVLGNALIKLGRRLQGTRVQSNQSYQTTDGKYAL